MYTTTILRSATFRLPLCEQVVFVCNKFRLLCASLTIATTAVLSRIHEDDSVKEILREISLEGERLQYGEVGSRESLLKQARNPVLALESPLESIYAFMLAEVFYLPNIRSS